MHISELLSNETLPFQAQAAFETDDEMKTSQLDNAGAVQNASKYKWLSCSQNGIPKNLANSMFIFCASRLISIRFSQSQGLGEKDKPKLTVLKTNELGAEETIQPEKQEFWRFPQKNNDETFCLDIKILALVQARAFSEEAIASAKYTIKLDSEVLISNVVLCKNEDQIRSILQEKAHKKVMACMRSASWWSKKEIVVRNIKDWLEDPLCDERKAREQEGSANPPASRPVYHPRHLDFAITTSRCAANNSRTQVSQGPHKNITVSAGISKRSFIENQQRKERMMERIANLNNLMRAIAQEQVEISQQLDDAFLKLAYLKQFRYL